MRRLLTATAAGIMLMTSCSGKHEVNAVEKTYTEQAMEMAVKGIPETDLHLDAPLEKAISKGDSMSICAICYMKAMIESKNRHIPRAYDNYLAAENHICAATPPELKYSIYKGLSGLYATLQYRDGEYKSIMNAKNAAYESGNMALIQDACRLAGITCREMSDYGNSIKYLSKAMALTDPSDSLQIASLAEESGISYLSCGKADSALYFLEYADRMYGGNENLCRTIIKCLHQYRKGDRAFLDTFEQLVSGFTDAKRADAYKYISRILKNEGYTGTATAYLEKHLRLRDSLESNRKDELIEKLKSAREYKRQRFEIERAGREIEKRKQNIGKLSALLVITILLTITVHYIQYRKRASMKMKLMDSEKEKMRISIEYLNVQNENRRLELDSLKQKVDYFKRLNDITIPALMQTKNGMGALNLTEKEWKTVRENTNACFENFTVRLATEYPQLSEEEINFCCLVKMELPIAILSEIYHIAKGSISRRKMRLKEKMDITDQSFDEFISAY